MPAAEELHWEFRPFTFDGWRPGQKWSFLATTDRFQDYQASLVARQVLWEMIAPTVMEQLEPWQAEGWQPIESLGPDSFDLTKTERTDAHFGLEDVLLGALTLTVAPFLYGIVRSRPKRFVSYVPCAFTFTLRRPVKTAEAQPAA